MEMEGGVRQAERESEREMGGECGIRGKERRKGHRH